MPTAAPDLHPATEAPAPVPVAPKWFGKSEVAATIDSRRARALIEWALGSGFDPAQDPNRINTPAGAGHFLLMPSTLGPWSGIKVLSVAPDNPAIGFPRIQATYVLMDARTLTTRALIDGSLLTELRTPAVSAVAAERLAAPDASHLVVFGTGPQALAHIEAMAEIRPLRKMTVVGRSADKAAVAVAKAAALGLEAVSGDASAAADADIIVCATSAKDPLFDGSLVKDGACVIAMGSHETDRRELDAGLLGRSLVVVEDTATALREAGDVTMAIADGTLDGGTLVPLLKIVRGTAVRRTDAPNVFKSVGMSWQDLAVAIGVVDPHAGS